MIASICLFPSKVLLKACKSIAAPASDLLHTPSMPPNGTRGTAALIHSTVQITPLRPVSWYELAIDRRNSGNEKHGFLQSHAIQLPRVFSTT